MRLSLLVALSLASGAAGAQAQKPPAQEERPPVSTEPAPRLNLRLDDAARYSREAPREGSGSAPLPTLGGDARPLPARTQSNPLDGPFPKDSERGER